MGAAGDARARWRRFSFKTRLPPSPPRRDLAPLALHTSTASYVHATHQQPGSESPLGARVARRLTFPPHALSACTRGPRGSRSQGVACAYHRRRHAVIWRRSLHTRQLHHTYTRHTRSQALIRRWVRVLSTVAPPLPPSPYALRWMTLGNSGLITPSSNILRGTKATPSTPSRTGK